MKYPIIVLYAITLGLLTVAGLNMVGCVGLTPSKTSVASSLPTLKSYAETLYNALETANTVVKQNQATLDAVAGAWGVKPSTIEQANLYDDEIAQVVSASGDQAKVTAVLQAVVDSTEPHSYWHLHPNRDLRNVYGDTAYASIYDLSR